jgi:hypothetical protein
MPNIRDNLIIHLCLKFLVLTLKICLQKNFHWLLNFQLNMKSYKVTSVCILYSIYTHEIFRGNLFSAFEVLRK